MEKISKKEKEQLFALIIGSLTLLVIHAVISWGINNIAAKNQVGKDFLIHWVGTRSFVYEGISPYSDETNQKIRDIVVSNEPQDFEQELRVIYPFYSEFIYIPFSIIEDYSTARVFWMVLLEVSIVVTVFAAICLSGWKPASWLLFLFLSYSLLCYQSIWALINGNVVVLVGLLVVLALRAIRDNNDIAAGLFLASATIKPHLVVMLIVFILLWAISQKRWTLIAGIIGGILGLIALGMLLIPDWILQNIEAIISIPGYNPILSMARAFETRLHGIGTQLKWGSVFILTTIVLVEWVQTLKKQFIHFLWTCCLTLAISQWIGLGRDPGNSILLILPIILIFSIIKERWKIAGDWIVLFVLIVLFAGVWSLYPGSIESLVNPLQRHSMLLPAPLFSIVGLYWIKWWVIRQTRGVL